MKITATANIVLRHFAHEWSTRSPNLAHYFETQFGYVTSRPLQIDRLIILQMRDGDVGQNRIGSYIMSKWVLQCGKIEVAPPQINANELNQTDASGEIYVSPHFRFCFDEDVILLSESYGSGPGIHTRRRRAISYAPITAIEMWNL